MKRVHYHGRSITLTPAYHPPVGPDRGWWAHARVGRETFYAATQHDAERLAKRYIRSTEVGVARSNPVRARTRPTAWGRMSYGERIFATGTVSALVAGGLYLLGKSGLVSQPSTPVLLAVALAPPAIIALPEG